MNINQMLDSGPAAAPKQQQQPQQYAHQQHPPSTPVQNIPPQSFQDYSQHHQASPVRQPSHSYASHQAPPAAYASPPTSYQNPYPGRPAPPSLQSLPSNEMRSPSIASVVAPSPYRQTPTLSTSGSGGYPFPPTHQTPTSPVQRHQYPPAGQYPPRDSFSQPAVPAGPTGVPGTTPYGQGPSPLPQTPPVGTASTSHSYVHQRSQSAHSTPTPTSAHSQQQYGLPYVQGSPVAMSHPPPSMDQGRHQSQPPTPLGPPLSGPRQLSVPPSYTQPQPQPPSPYQQRVSVSGGHYHQPVQGSPPPPAPPPTQRLPSDQTGSEPPSSDSHRRQPSHGERDRSLSVSPKTRVPSLSSSTGQTAVSQSDTEPRHSQIRSASAMPSAIEPDRERAITPAKRKLEDRDLRPEELERRDMRPAPFEGVNGSHATGPSSSQTSQAAASPATQRKKPRRYNSPPTWAARHTTDRNLKAVNFVLRKVVHHHVGQINGKPGKSSRQTSPDERRAGPAAQTAPPAHSTPASAPAPTPGPAALPNADRQLGPWEPSITGTRPYEDMAKTIADFLFLNVLANPDRGEISSRQVQFEIEAKLGTLISKDTNDRVNLPVTTECVLVDNGRVAFRSSMTEVHHKAFNDYLNSLVYQADPRNPANAEQPRVQIHYKHRREVDKFFELPPQMREHLPPCVQNRIPPKHTVKVRVTYDQKTNEVLAKIVKARIADIHIHFPMCPLDCRISINLEMAWDGSVEELQRLTAGRESLPDRNKDRLSYGQSHYQIDLTQVTQTLPGPNNTQRLEKEHELEIEVSPTVLVEQGQRASDGQPHQYQELVEGLIDNVRVLARKARDFA